MSIESLLCVGESTMHLLLLSSSEMASKVGDLYLRLPSLLTAKFLVSLETKN